MSRVQFTNRQGLKLTGDIAWPAGGEARAFALFAHCFTCTRSIKAAIHIAEALAGEGIAVLRFDFTGLGQSEGEFAATDFSSNVDDLEDAAAYLSAHHQAPQILIGHSLGGTAVLAVAPRIASCRAVAVIGAPADPAHVLHNFAGEVETILAEGSAEVNLGGRPFRIGRQFIADVRAQNLPARLRDLRRALLILHSPLDRIVGIDNAQQIFQHALHPKSFVSLDHADHLLSKPADSRYAGQVIASWAARYLDAVPAAEVAPGVIARGLTEAGFLTALSGGRHRLLADEPEDAGGGDLGPSPYDYLAAALAACTTMTLNLYARHKNLPLSRVSCHVTHHRVHAADCEACTTKEGRIDVFERAITIEGEIEPAVRQRLREIADRCPVHRTLENEIKIRTELTGPAGA